MAVIKLQSNFIEFPFENEKGEVVLTLKFDKSDENFKQLEKTYDELNKKMGKINEQEESEVEQGKEILKEAVDQIFGEGSFDKMYQLSPSILLVFKYLVQMVEGIYQEINIDKDTELLKKYLK